MAQKPSSTTEWGEGERMRKFFAFLRTLVGFGNTSSSDVEYAVTKLARKLAKNIEAYGEARVGTGVYDSCGDEFTHIVRYSESGWVLDPYFLERRGDYLAQVSSPVHASSLVEAARMIIAEDHRREMQYKELRMDKIGLVKKTDPNLL